MATTTKWISLQGSTRNITSGVATIDNGETSTLGIPCGGRSVVRLQFPSAFTGTTVTFTAQALPSTVKDDVTYTVPFVSVVDKDGNAISYTVAASKIVTIPELSGVFAFKIVSGSAEGAARQIFVEMVGENPVAVATEIDVNIESGATLTANQGTAAAYSSAWPTYPVPQTSANTSPSVDVSAAAEASSVAKASAGTAYGFSANSSAAGYIQFHNATSLPANTTVPFLTYPIAANETIAYDFGVYGERFSTGIVIAYSTTQQTLTIGGAVMLANVRYV